MSLQAEGSTSEAEEVAALRAALAAERAKADAFADLNHELRTLLSGIFGITELLLDTELSAEQKDYVKRMRTHCEAIAELVNNVLDYSRAEAGKLKLEAADLDVRRVVEDVGELFSGRAHEKGIELCVAIADGIPTGLRGDPARLRQVLVNLVGNAIKFTEHGEVVIAVTLAEIAYAYAVVRFVVRDTGLGISPEGQARLFQPFSQVHGAGGYGGSGLGLALARRIVEAMGGEIGVESTEREGSRFQITARFERRPQGLDRGAIPRVDVAGRRVIVAAPNAEVRQSLREMIGALDVEQAAADRSDSALALLHEAAAAGRAYDVALLDLGLAGAAELFNAIDTDPLLTSLRVVLLSYPGQRLVEDESVAQSPAHPDPAYPPARPVAQSPAHPDSPARSAMRTQGSPNTGSSGRGPRTVTHLAKPVRRARLLSCLRTLLGSSLETVARADAMPESRRAGHAVPPGAAGPASRMPRSESSPRSAGTGLRLAPTPAATVQAVTASHPTPKPQVRPGATPPSPPVSDERPHVLLVEDNAVNQRVGKLMLERRGYRVDVASDGHEAVAATARTAYAAVLMDCQMPRHDGYAATREIRDRDTGKPRLPIIAMTANAGPGARERCLAAGMDDYIAKPVTAEAIDETLSRWVPRGALPPPAPMPPRRVSSPVIDLGMLHKLRAAQRPEEPDIVVEVAHIFLQEAPSRMSAIREAVTQGDLVAAGRAVHTLKGSAGHLGAKTLVALCARFEEKMRSGAEINAAFAAEAIGEELDRVCRALKAATSKPST